MDLAALGEHLFLALALVVVGGSGLLAAGAGLYLVVLSSAALVRPRHRPEAPRGSPRVTLLVPAHDEAALVGRCVRSLLEQSYPSSHYEVVVVADNCSDATASVAEAAGATVLVREDAARPGKGRALRWAMDTVLSAEDPPEAIGVVDADSVAEPDFLACLVEEERRGWPVVQGEYLALTEGSSARAQLRAAAFLLFHRVRFAGRAVLGLPCALVGNGMLFSAPVLRAHPWSAFSNVEDLEYSIELRLAGIRPRFAPTARIVGPVSAGGRAARIQRLRWEGGRLDVVRRRLPALLGAIVRERRLDLLDAAVDLAVPPLGILAAIALAGLGAAVGLGVAGDLSPMALTLWAVAVLAVPLHVLLGLIAGHAPSSMYRALLIAPALVVAELATRARLLGGLNAGSWVRTERPGEQVRATRQEP